MNRTARIIGVPMDYGADRRGVDMGPSAIRYAGLAEEFASIGIECVDGGDLLVPRAEERDPDTDAEVEGRAKFLEEVRDANERLAEEVAAAIDTGEFPLVLGGDHSIAIGSLRGSAAAAEIGVLWLDAHGDFNTPVTTPSGNIHGMPLAAVLGEGAFADTEWANAPAVSESNVAIVGLRQLDENEREALAASDVSAFTMSDIDERGIGDVINEALEIASAGVEGIHVSLDLDFLDPNEAPGVGTPVRGGVTYREAHLVLEEIARRDERHDILRSMDLVEVNPILDESNETAALATELAASGLGKRVL